MPVAIGRALRLIEAHPSVVEVLADATEGSSTVEVLVSIKTELPGEWRGAGESPSGVKVVEDVTFRFDERYPTEPPEIHLRADFDRTHPHLQPRSAEEYPEPCLFAGSPRELLRLRGIVGLVEQLVEWLDRASRVELIDPKHGWEPTRRDHVDDVIVADAQWMRDLVTADGGCPAFKLRYLAGFGETGAATYWITLRRSDPVPIAADIGSDFTFKDLDHARIGSGIGLVTWAGKKADGNPFVADRYMPETVFSIAELLARAQSLGCREYLEPKLLLLQSRVRESKMKVPVPLAVVILAKRPYPVIGAGSIYELCPYVVEIDGNDDLSKKSSKKVRPAMHREDISVALLRAASGQKVADNGVGPWALLGCGSVGSKIALHMARQGRGPKSVTDKSYMSPHNFARHAAYPRPSSSKYGLLDYKTALLAEALTAVAQPTTQHTIDIVGHLQRKSTLAPIVDKDTFAVVNTTGSATVREVLGTSHLSGVRPRVIEACLLGMGKVGLLTAEGPKANPSTVDLICECYSEIHRRPDMAADVFRTDATEVLVGQGCAALTLPLSDSRLSMFSAAMAEKVSGYQREGLPAEGGELSLGHLQPDGLSVAWSQQKVQPRILVGRLAGGEIRINPAVDETIRAEIARKSKSETGGIIFGRYSDLSDSFHVVGTLPAPPDSKFSKNEFVLGVEGLKPMLDGLVEGTGGALYPLGTWHNHLFTSGPSSKDMRTAILLSGLQYFPLLMLIHTPGGYTAMSAETVRGISMGEAAE